MTDEAGQAPDTGSAPPRLAAAYRRALELDAAGASARRIAAALDLPIEAVPALLRLARAKRDAVTRDESPEP